MARPRESESFLSPEAQFMRRRRAQFEAEGKVQFKIVVVETFAQQLKALKAKYRLRGLDAVVTAMIDKAKTLYSPDEIIAPPPPPEGTGTHVIALNIPESHQEYILAVAKRNRGILAGIAVEAIGAYVTDLSPAPVQLSLIEGGAP